MEPHHRILLGIITRIDPYLIPRLILSSIKTEYCSHFLERMLDIVISDQSVRTFIKEFNIRNIYNSFNTLKISSEDDLWFTNALLNRYNVSSGCQTRSVCVCSHRVYIYIYILSSIDRSVSFYQNSSMSLDRQDSRSWDRNPVDSNANQSFYHSATRKPAQPKKI